jgi:hypothetical protein
MLVSQSLQTYDAFFLLANEYLCFYKMMNNKKGEVHKNRNIKILDLQIVWAVLVLYTHEATSAIPARLHQI